MQTKTQSAPGFGPPEDAPGFGPPEDSPQGVTPSGQLMKPLPIHPLDWMDVAAGAPEFFRQVKQAAGSDLSSAWTGIKSAASDAGKALKEDPSRIVPMWFGGEMRLMGGAAKAVKTASEFAAGGDILSAVSSAAGGDPQKANEYRNNGNYGGEFWEMMGKPLALIATGKAAGAIGGTVAEGTEIARLRVIRGFMEDAGGLRTGMTLEDAKLAQQAIQDAAREVYGSGSPGVRGMKASMPSRDKGIRRLLTGNPGTVSEVEEGNKELVSLSRKAVDIAGGPADKVNAVYGYLDGRAAAANIKRALESQASDAERKGLTSYAKALRDRASSMDGKKTLGEIYDVKKSANKLADVARNTQEAIDLMDSWSALASAIREEVYPIYDGQIAKSGETGFSLSAAGRKEGAAMQLRNGLEKRWAKAQAATDALHSPGTTLQQAAHGMSEGHTVRGAVVRKLEEKGILPDPQGALNSAGRKAIGRLSPDTVPESLKVTGPAKFGPSPPATKNLLPGKTYEFSIQGTPTISDTEGRIGQSAAHASKHSHEPPAYTTSSAPTRTATFAPNGRVVAGNEGGVGADISTAVTPEGQSDVARGGGTLITTDPKVAQSALERMERLEKSPRILYADKVKLRQAIKDLRRQLDEYQSGIGGAQISHTPPKLAYTARKIGKVPVNHVLRRGAPAFISDVDREDNNDQ